MEDSVCAFFAHTANDGKVYNVTQIGTKSFYGCTGLKSVIIGNNVTLIEENAFEICTVIEHSFPEVSNTSRNGDIF